MSVEPVSKRPSHCPSQMTPDLLGAVIKPPAAAVATWESSATAWLASPQNQTITLMFPKGLKDGIPFLSHFCFMEFRYSGKCLCKT